MIPFLSEGGFNPFTVEPGLIFWNLIVFALLLAVLGKFGWKPLLRSLDAREARIRAEVEAAEKAGAEARALAASWQEKNAAAALEARRVLDEARATGEKARRELVEAGQAERTALLEKARREIDAEKQKALAEIKAQVVELSVAISRRVVSRSVDRAEHARIADEVLERAGDVA